MLQIYILGTIISPAGLQPLSCDGGLGCIPEGPCTEIVDTFALT